MIELSDQDILRRLTDTEDSTVERKTASDYRDCLRTAVAFSNSLPIGDPGIIYVGVRNDGTVQDNLNLDSLQKKVSEEIGKIYPPICPQMKGMRDKDGKEFLAVIVRGSQSRPHFGGKSYIRDGSQSKEASEQQFERLIAERDSKAREILKWLRKRITFRLPEGERVTLKGLVSFGSVSARVVACNQFFVSLQFPEAKDATTRAYPLTFIEIGYDHGEKRLELIGLPY